MIRSLSSFALLASLALTGAARADQCAYIPAAQATKAQKILKEMSQALPFCEPCGEKKPGRITSVKASAVTLKRIDAKLTEVRLNGKGLDLAYVYVRKSPNDTFKNLARLAGCKTTGVTPELRGMRN